jgi:hypothetical protein
MYFDKSDEDTECAQGEPKTGKIGRATASSYITANNVVTLRSNTTDNLSEQIGMKTSDEWACDAAVRIALSACTAYGLKLNRLVRDRYLPRGSGTKAFSRE